MELGVELELGNTQYLGLDKWQNINQFMFTMDFVKLLQ